MPPVTDDIQQMVLFADAVRDGAGRIILTPRRPQLEVGTVEAARIIGVSRATMAALRDDPRAMQILRCRFTTPSCKILAWNVASLQAYREASKSWEGG
jgi:hypothetical protein